MVMVARPVVIQFFLVIDLLQTHLIYGVWLKPDLQFVILTG